MMLLIFINKLTGKFGTPEIFMNINSQHLPINNPIV